MQTDVVIGPPGCGKTTWLARQVELAVAAGERPVVMSLTRAAAREAASRGLPLKQGDVGTLHSHAWRALDRPEIAESAKHLKRWNKLHPYYAMQLATRDIDEDNATPSGESFSNELMTKWQLIRARMESEDDLSPAAKKFVKAWREWTTHNNLVDFTGLIEQSLKTTFWAPSHPTVIFIDEAQDLSKLELSLLMHWASDADRLVMVGDPWQNLYEWRGTDADAFSQITEDGVQRVLSQSYRVPKAVHAKAMQWIRNMYGWSPIEYAPTDEPGAVHENAATWQAPEEMLDSVQESIANGKTVMVLTSCAYMLTPLVSLLRERGIPFHNPYREKSARWNPLGKRRGVSAVDRILAFLAPSSSYSMRWKEGDVEAWTRIVNAKATIRSGRRKDIASINDDLNTAEDILTREAMDAVWNADLDWLKFHALSERKTSLEYPIRVVKAQGYDALRQSPRLIIGTIHSVKGGEADEVFLCPDLSGAGMDQWESGAVSQAGIYRLFYVAMTRAKETLHLCDPASDYAVSF